MQLYIRVTEYFILLMFKDRVHRNVVEHERKELAG